MPGAAVRHQGKAQGRCRPRLPSTADSHSSPEFLLGRKPKRGSAALKQHKLGGAGGRFPACSLTCRVLNLQFSNNRAGIASNEKAL